MPNTPSADPRCTWRPRSLLASPFCGRSSAIHAPNASLKPLATTDAAVNDRAGGRLRTLPTVAEAPQAGRSRSSARRSCEHPGLRSRGSGKERGSAAVPDTAKEPSPTTTSSTVACPCFRTISTVSDDARVAARTAAHHRAGSMRSGRPPIGRRFWPEDRPPPAWRLRRALPGARRWRVGRAARRRSRRRCVASNRAVRWQRRRRRGGRVVRDRFWMATPRPAATSAIITTMSSEL
jgi:hypothetical protein